MQEDWFEEAPVETRELLPSHFDNWKYYCRYCDNPSFAMDMNDGKCYCIHHLEEVIEEWMQ